MNGEKKKRKKSKRMDKKNKVILNEHNISKL
jgi:hypothetical protein